MTPVVRTGPAATAGAPQLEGAKHRSVETARNRLLAAGIIFAFVFLVMAGRLVGLTVFDGASSRSFVDAEAATDKASRGDILDRNGVLLATSLPAASVYADPQQILDADAAVADLARVLPDLDREAVRARLTSSSHFVWVRRGLTPEQHQAVNALGIPGLDFICERRRVYPHGRALAHVVGLTDIDGHGIAGV